MNILIDIGHPAHVHLFKNAARKFIEDGHSVLFTCRDKEFEIQLLETNGFNYVSFGKKFKSLTGKIWGLLKFVMKEWKVCLRFKPDVLLSHGSPYAAIASRLYGKSHITFDDTFNMEQVRLFEPFSKVVLTGKYEHPVISRKEIHYDAYHELAYLHPKYFTPDASVLEDLHVSPDEKYVLVRFVAWNASHDIGHAGISAKNKINAIQTLSRYAKVFISSEGSLPAELERFRLKTRPEQLHSVIAFASLVWGESLTIPSEASVLGVPSVVNHNTKSCILEDQKKRYDICYTYSESYEDQLKALNKCVEILKRNKEEIRTLWAEKSRLLVSEHIDLTAFLVWFVENYPSSKDVIQNNPDYQYIFR